MPRQPILSVLGHVDSGKTTLLDNIRESKIVEGEAGGITQMIGATEIPLNTVENVCGDLLQQLDTDLTIPGLLFIDTPGHAAFSSLRKRGGSISDIAVLVIDVEEGVQPQTEEAIKILKDSQTPFVIALNKIDMIPGWKTDDECFSRNLKNQSESIRQKLDEEIYELMADLNDYGFVIDRFDRVDNFTEKIGVVPISAKTGEGLPELLMVVSGLAQNYLSDQLEVKEGDGKATVLEVSEQKGFGKTIDVIHYDGIIRKNDKLVFGTAEGPEVTDIRALLKPRPLKEIRLDKQYEEVDQVYPASGIKIAGKDLSKVVSGAPVRTGTDIEKLKGEVRKELETSDYDIQTSGVIVKADSLGSLEALMREIDEMDIRVQKAEVGPIRKSDIIEVENEEPVERAILSFNSAATDEAEQLAESKDIRIFQSSVIYEILDDYSKWKKEAEEERRMESLANVSRPAEIRTLQDHVFRSSNPVVIGMTVVEGVLNQGSLMTEDGEKVGRIKSIQDDNESLDKAEKGDQVALSIAKASLERDFEAGDHLYVDINSEDYRKLQHLEDLLSKGEKKALEKIVEIKDSVDPHWKLG
ncbi:translation initiation factor IF-2 [Candidatus Haloredivivus sp. G17]|nr:translation initiation factor IF-2 [Candidatus Haloredivivus sp. G17]